MRLLRPIKEKHAVPEPPEDGCLNERRDQLRLEIRMIR